MSEVKPKEPKDSLAAISGSLLAVSREFKNQAQEREFRRLFEKGDRDKNGTLDRKELRAIIRAIFKKNEVDFNAEFLTKYTNDMFSQFDVNSDGCLDFSEFVQLYRTIMIDPSIPQEMKASIVNIEKIRFHKVSDEGRIIQTVDSSALSTLLETDPSQIELFNSNLTKFQSLHHPHIFSYDISQIRPDAVDFVYDSSEFSVFFTGRDYQHTFHQFTNGDAFSTRAAKVIAIIEATGFLHSLNLSDIHLSIENIASVNGTPKIYNYQLGLLYRLSPEMQDNKIFIAKDDVRGPLCDIYSIGIFLLIILTRKMPEINPVTECVALPAPDNIYNIPVAPTLWDLECPDRCKRNLIDLTLECLSRDPAKRPQSTGAVLQRLRNCMMDAVILDPLGNTFWKTFFLANVEVSFREFMHSFEEFFNMKEQKQDDIFYEMKSSALQFLLSGGEQMANTVKIEEFSRVLCWFGPLEPDEGKKVNILYRIEQQLGKQSFFGTIEAPQATEMLKKQKEGTYMVRFSGTVPGCYSLTTAIFVPKKNSVQVVHVRIYHKPGGRFYHSSQQQEPSFGTLEEFLSQLAIDFHLKSPLAAPTPYSQIFNTYKTHNDLYQRPQFYDFDVRDGETMYC